MGRIWWFINLYQSKYKIPSTLEVLEKAYGKDRYISVARELTKLHETILVGTIAEVALQYQNVSSKGRIYHSSSSP